MFHSKSNKLMKIYPTALNVKNTHQLIINTRGKAKILGVDLMHSDNFIYCQEKAQNFVSVSDLFYRTSWKLISKLLRAACTATVTIPNYTFLKKFSVKKGTLPLRWVAIQGPFDCRSNSLSSELRRFHNFSHRIY